MAGLVLFSLSSFAQDLDVRLNGVPDAPNLHMKVKVRGPRDDAAGAPAMAVTAPPVRTVGVDTFQVEYSPLGGPPAQISVLSPEGAQAQVWNEDGSLAGTYSVPFNFNGRASTYYRFILTDPSGELLFDRKLEAKTYLWGALKQRRARVAAPPPPAQVVVVAPPPPVVVAPPETTAAMLGDADFDSLLSAIDHESFSDEKLGVLSTALPTSYFTVAQVGRLVDAFVHSSDKVKVVELTRGHLVDRHNGYKLFEHFTFASDKEQVKALLR